MIMECTHQEDTKIINTHIPKYTKQISTNFKRQIDGNTLRMGHIDSQLEWIMHTHIKSIRKHFT